MYNSIDETRKAAWRKLKIQLAVTAAIALLLFMMQGRGHAWSALLGGMAVAAGGAVYAWCALAGSTPSAGRALAGLLLGLVLKWGIVVGVLYLALARFGMLPLSLMVGVVGSTLSLLFVGKN